MAQPAPKPDRVTVAEFLRFEGERDVRYELVRGEIVAMAPAMRRHRIIAARLAAALANRLRPPCAAESEAGILLPWSDGDYYVADLAVSCAPVGDERWCPDPVLVVEVLSPSTERDDRGLKLNDYRHIPSVQDVLLVASTRPLVEHNARSDPFWRVQELGPGDTVRLEGLGIEVPVDELYAGLAFDAAGEA
jgi:Uma2 family endonuclease